VLRTVILGWENRRSWRDHVGSTSLLTGIFSIRAETWRVDGLVLGLGCWVSRPVCVESNRERLVRKFREYVPNLLRNGRPQVHPQG
jgi:hypothetical protein